MSLPGGPVAKNIKELFLKCADLLIKCQKNKKKLLTILKKDKVFFSSVIKINPSKPDINFTTALFFSRGVPENRHRSSVPYCACSAQQVMTSLARR